MTLNLTDVLIAHIANLSDLSLGHALGLGALESTYNFLRDMEPGLLSKLTYSEAKTFAQQQAKNAKPMNPNGVKMDDITCSQTIAPPTPLGRGAEYLTARIARDRPDILQRMKAGEFPSVRAAALAPGARRGGGVASAVADR